MGGVWNPRFHALAFLFVCGLSYFHNSFNMDSNVLVTFVVFVLGRSFGLTYYCSMTRSGTRLRVGILLGIDEWKSRCNLPPSGGKLRLRHLPISDFGYWAAKRGQVGATCHALLANCTCTMYWHQISVNMMEFRHEDLEKVCPNIIKFCHEVVWFSPIAQI